MRFITYRESVMKMRIEIFLSMMKLLDFRQNLGPLGKLLLY
jgi:hypothetical protein